jgi:hypothetical protein
VNHFYTCVLNLAIRVPPAPCPYALGVRFVDKKMQARVREVVSEYDRDIADMTRRLNETGRVVPRSEFLRGFEAPRESAHKKLSVRAAFWNFTLERSPVETHLGEVMDAKAGELMRLYTGAALLRLSAAAAKSKLDFLAGLKAARPREYLKEAVQQAAAAPGKKAAKVGALDYKALTAALHVLVRAGDQAMVREAHAAELERDRVGAQYLEEHRRWLGALQVYPYPTALYPHP